MTTKAQQGDILKLGEVRYPILVVSTNFFNETELIVGCPIIKDMIIDSPLHIAISTDKISGCVMCEDMRKFDTRIRRYSILDRIKMSDIINITDAIQSIFDYI